MSRIGKKPIDIPENVTVEINGQEITVKGIKGELKRTIDSEIKISKDDNKIIVERKSKGNVARAKWGLFRSLINNMVIGTSQGFSKTLDIKGVGYKAQIKDKFLTLNLGYSHEIKFYINDNIEMKCPKATIIEISSYDKEALGQAAATIRSLRKPEPYKGKGVKYSDEFIVRKEGKK